MRSATRQQRGRPIRGSSIWQMRSTVNREVVGSSPTPGALPAYVIYQGEVSDPERYEQYKPLVAASVEAAGGRYVARGGATEALESDPPAGRTVLIEFPTMQAATDWYNGVLYTQARAVRKGAATARVFVVDGV